MKGQSDADAFKEQALRTPATPDMPMSDSEDSPLAQDDPGVDYMQPDQGPFKCGNCSHFQDPNSCEIVSGNIEPEGCCNLFASGTTEGDDNGINGSQSGLAGQRDQSAGTF